MAGVVLGESWRAELLFMSEEEPLPRGKASGFLSVRVVKTKIESIILDLRLIELMCCNLMSRTDVQGATRKLELGNQFTPG